MPAPLPFGHDPDNPPFGDIRSTYPELVREPGPDGKPLVRVFRAFENVAVPGIAPLVLSAQQLSRDGADDPAADRLLDLMRRVRLYYVTFSPPDEFPADVELTDNKALQAMEAQEAREEELTASFEHVFEAESDAENLIAFTLEYKGPIPGDDDPPVNVGVTIDPPIYGGDLHGYKPRCMKSVYVRIRATAGRVRLRVYRSGYSIGMVEDDAGGSASPFIGSSSGTNKTYDIAVRGLCPEGQINDYGVSAGWTLGSGPGC
jgi:hypothetical protein